MNTKPKINQKIEIITAISGADDARPLQHVTALLGLSRHRLGPSDVLNLIDTRQIRWAWDIARRGARRPELRIWRPSLLAALAREHGQRPGPEGKNLTLGQVIDAILPRPASIVGRAAALGLSELQRRFFCCRNHISGLIADGELAWVGRTRSRNTDGVLYQSVVEFLKRRSLSV